MKGVIIPVFFIFLFFSAHFAHSQFEVDVLLEKATYLLYDCQFEGALRLNEKADSIALTKNDQILHAKTVNQRAYFFARIGQNDSAAYLLARQSKMAFENKWFPVYYESRFYTGVNQLFMGNLPAAKQTFSSLLDELSHSSKDQSQLLGRTLTNLALIAFAESDISSAEYLVSQSNLYLENEESTLFKVSNMNLQALLFHKRGKMLDAINWYKNTLDEYRKSGRTLNKPNVYLGIANVYGDLGKTVPAKMYLDSARILARSTGQVQELGLIYEASFTYYFEQKDFQKSIDFLLLKSKLVDSLRSAERIIAVEKTELLGQKALDEVKMDLLERQLENQEKNNRKQKVWVFLAIVVSLYMVGFVIAFKRLINQKNTSQKALIERNKELLNKNEQIAQTQNRLIQSEKMALLGRLSAGIAHELNSPLSAIKANLELVDNLQYDELRGMVRLSSQVSYEEIEGLQELIEYSILSHQQSVSTAEDRKRKEWVREYLSKESIDHKEEIIEFFEELKIREGIQKFEWIYKHRYSVDLLELSLNMVNRFTSVSIARKAIGQTEKILSSFKSYSFKRGWEDMKAFDVVKNIDLILSLHQNSLKEIQVIKDINGNTMIKGIPDELSQVWTNLISNAAYAMKYEGKLWISIDGKPDGVFVSIEDSGGGIRESDKEKIFEAFFTTKPEGEGSGLGLDICRQIIIKHNGSINWENTSAGVKFKVFLPGNN